MINRILNVQQKLSLAMGFLNSLLACNSESIEATDARNNTAAMPSAVQK